MRPVCLRQYKQNVNIRTRRQGRPAIAANGGNRVGFALRGECPRMNVSYDITDDLADDFVLKLGKAAGAGKTAAVVLKCLTDKFAALFERSAKNIERFSPGSACVYPA